MGVDTETSARGNVHCVVVRDIQRLKVTTAFGVHKHRSCSCVLVKYSSKSAVVTVNN